ncbi:MULTISPECIES: hypothetical protein [unclassified Microbacterium]|uniref:hypothetical protein n=1 Tax=unclassified Microbacterium TaxID=2609290 RepID=UPI000EA9113C|nr:MULTISPECIES: hypothetical protein [unclassified Microbacterium]MBT2484693.1 hypothetical protein [Microbacterium sp. ISL-108]RKN67578.1 hypothetical protein D7252_08285 [Microbacterium sp. CGR2]
MRKSFTSALAVTGLLAIVSLTASGCSVVDELAHHKKSSEFADAASLEADGDLEVAWLPRDSSGIRVVQSTQADDAAVAVVSEGSLPSAMCIEVPRQSAPPYVIDDTVDVYGVSSVFACGEWTVAETPTGWLGWTPNHPDEKAQSPAS